VRTGNGGGHEEGHGSDKDHHLAAEFETLIGGSDALPIDPDLDSVSPGSGGPRADSVGRQGRENPFARAAVFIGGFAGTLGRYELGLSWRERVATFPRTTFVINISGALLLGLILTAILELPLRQRYLRQLLCVGLLGGWTTMSTLAVEADHLFGAGSVVTALGYLVSSLLGGAAASAAGIALVRRFRPTVVTETGVGVVGPHERQSPEQ
jgi:CrcB protein